MNLTLILFIILSITSIIFLRLRRRNTKSKKRILDLENEMLSSHREILELQKQISDLQEDKDTDIEQHRIYAVIKQKEA